MPKPNQPIEVDVNDVACGHCDETLPKSTVKRKVKAAVRAGEATVLIGCPGCGCFTPIKLTVTGGAS